MYNENKQWNAADMNGTQLAAGKHFEASEKK
jgi:hypothetical protein